MVVAEVQSELLGHFDRDFGRGQLILAVFHAVREDISADEILRRRVEDVVFLDLDLGMDRDWELEDRGYDGLEILQYLSEQHCKAAIVLMSGLDRDKLQQTQNIGKELQLRVVGFFAKPFSLEKMTQLLKTIQRHMQGGLKASA